jgi:hypothetical protein
MRFVATYLAAVLLLSITAFPACSSDSSDTPGAEAGSGGRAQGGNAPQAGTSQGGATQAAGTSSGGSASGGRAGAGGSGGGDAGANQGGAGGEGDVVGDCLNAPVMPGTETQALRLTGEGIELGLVRHVELDALNDLPFVLQRFALVRGDVAECVTDEARLKYTFSHHNMADVMTASAGAQSWVVSASATFGDAWTIEGKTGGGATWGPSVLTIESCERIDSPGLVCNKTPSL